MAQGIGNLVDQLSVINIKLFMKQEIIHSGTYRDMTSEEKDKMIDDNRELNRQRNILIDEINEITGTGIKSMKTEYRK